MDWTYIYLSCTFARTAMPTPPVASPRWHSYFSGLACSVVHSLPSLGVAIEAILQEIRNGTSPAQIHRHNNSVVLESG